LFTDFADAIQHGHEFRARRRDLTKDGRVFEVEVRGIQLPLRGRPPPTGCVRQVLPGGEDDQVPSRPD
jgi:hypothetical protein